jgi:hypothetical protein
MRADHTSLVALPYVLEVGSLLSLVGALLFTLLQYNVERPWYNKVGDCNTRI